MIRSRLARLEKMSTVVDKTPLDAWCAFMDAFTDAELSTIVDNRAGRALMRRFAPAGRLEVPPELVGILEGICTKTG